MKNKQKQLKNKEKTSWRFKTYYPKIKIKDARLENTLSEEAKNELDKIKETEKTVDRENLYHRTNEYTYNFQNFQTVRTFDKDIYNDTITIKEANNDQSNLLVEILNFSKQVKPKNKKKKPQKDDVLKNLYNVFEGRERVLNIFDSKIIPTKIKGTGFFRQVLRPC